MVVPIECVYVWVGVVEDGSELVVVGDVPQGGDAVHVEAVVHLEGAGVGDVHPRVHDAGHGTLDLNLVLHYAGLVNTQQTSNIQMWETLI